jgi:hypothetical protein
MALQKSINTEFGVEATYWNIGAYQEDFKGGGGEITLYGYLNKDSRLKNCQPLSSGKVNLSGEEYIADANREQLYSILKTRPEFQGSTDV